MRQGYKGKFEQAQKGTIYLDDIGEIPPTMQVTLLRVLQEKKVTSIGGTIDVPLDIRIITTTHRDITDLVKRATGKVTAEKYLGIPSSIFIRG